MTERPWILPIMASQGGVMAERVVEVYWRPGCGYCDRLLRVLKAENIPLELHNIWEDSAAREFVQAHNNGNETVPTVVFGNTVQTNPDPRALVMELLRANQ
jgi:mycoredoxin